LSFDSLHLHFQLSRFLSKSPFIKIYFYKADKNANSFLTNYIDIMSTATHSNSMLKIISKGLKRILLSFAPITKDFSMFNTKSKNQQIMILGNPSSRRDSFFLLPLLFLLSIHNSHAQGVYGYVTESLTHHPVADARVSLMKEDVAVQHVLTDSAGFYKINTALAGQFAILIEAPGYTLVRIEDVLLDGYVEKRLEHDLHRESVVLQSVSVISSRRKYDPATILIHPDDLLTVAGNFEDPVRILHSQAGVVLLNDQSNQFALRGQSPMFNTWQLEGLEIANPSHTSNAGTFSDRPTQSGGGINMFSAQMLGSTVVYTGLNPMSTGRTAGAVINMHLHETTKPEWRARAGLIGLELGGGLATGEKGILDFNLRYSFTGLLANLGVDFGGEKIGFYDGVLSYLHRGKKHKLKLFYWTGRSENEFEKPETPERFKDFFDITYENDIRGAGLRFDFQLSDRSKLLSGVVASSTHSRYKRDGEFDGMQTFVYDEGQTNILSSFVNFSHQINTAIQGTAGVDLVRHNYILETTFYYPLTDITRIRPNLDFSIQLNRRINLELGGEVVRLSDDDYESWQPGGRALLKWNPSHRLQVFSGIRNASSHHTVRGPMDVTTAELGATYRASNHVIGLTAYTQYLDDVYGAEFRDVEGFLHMADFLEPITRPLFFDVTPGLYQARYSGIEGKWLFNGADGWSWHLNQSIYSVKRGPTADQLERGRFDGKWASHLMLAKSWVRTKNEKQRTWNISMRGIFNGGLWEETIWVEASDAQNTTIYETPGVFEEQLPAFKRIDLSVSRTTAFSKSRLRWMLDIQNAFGMTNIAYHYFDPFLNRVEPQEHLGIIPVLSLQLSW
jgi:hypothetical protein